MRMKEMRKTKLKGRNERHKNQGKKWEPKENWQGNIGCGCGF